MYRSAVRQGRHEPASRPPPTERLVQIRTPFPRRASYESVLDTSILAGVTQNGRIHHARITCLRVAHHAYLQLHARAGFQVYLYAIRLPRRPAVCVAGRCSRTHPSRRLRALESRLSARASPNRVPGLSVRHSAPRTAGGVRRVPLQQDSAVAAPACAGESLQRSRIAGDQRFLLRTTPAFQLTFTDESRANRRMALRVDERDGRILAGRSPTAMCGAVLGEATGEVARHADVEAACAEPEDVEVRGGGHAMGSLWASARSHRSAEAVGRGKVRGKTTPGRTLRLASLAQGHSFRPRCGRKEWLPELDSNQRPTD